MVWVSSGKYSYLSEEVQTFSLLSVKDTIELHNLGEVKLETVLASGLLH